MEHENPRLRELTPEQYAAGREIAELCGIGEDILAQNMLRIDQVATVEYGLAHSAHHMERLTVEQIRLKIFQGIADYQAMIDESTQEG